MTRQTKGSYDYIVVGGGAAGSVVAGELSKTGVEVLLIESGGVDSAPTISNPSIWFYNVGGPMDWNVPITPVPQLNNRKFNMALGRVLGLQGRACNVQEPGGLGGGRQRVARCGRPDPCSQTGYAAPNCSRIPRSSAANGLRH